MHVGFNHIKLPYICLPLCLSVHRGAPMGAYGRPPMHTETGRPCAHRWRALRGVIYWTLRSRGVCAPTAGALHIAVMDC